MKNHNIVMKKAPYYICKSCQLEIPILLKEAHDS